MYVYNLAGILVIGGEPSESASQSVEIWSAVDPEQGSCVLNDYPRRMDLVPTVNLVSGHLVACYDYSCDIYQEVSWKHLQNTTVRRKFHSSASMKDAVLLIGGGDPASGGSNSTEWIPVDGSPAQPGPFTVRHGSSHCTIQISDTVIVVTGGYDTFNYYVLNYVTQYQLDDGSETALTPLGAPRMDHACGVYQDTVGQQVSKRGMLQKFCLFDFE